MQQEIKKVLVVRILQNMAVAVSMQDINITACTFEGQIIHLNQENIQESLKHLKRDFKNQNFVSSFKNLFTLIKIIWKIKPEIIHVNALQDLAPAFLATRICAFNGKRPAIIAMSHNPLSWRKPNDIWRNSKFIKYLSDGFVALASTHKNQLLELGIPARMLTVIPNPYDPAQRNIEQPSQVQKVERSKKDFKIIYVANICERKAQDILVQAASHVVKAYPNVKFELIGKVIEGDEAYAANLESLIMESHLEKSVQLRGEIPYAEVLSSLHECDLFIFPTYAEMMPRAVIEAMVIGKPVIASAVDGILDLIENGKTGILVQPGNVSELSASIIQLIENPELTDSLAKAGQIFVLKYCSPEKVGKEFVDFYQYIYNNRKGK
jgi:glycosyltransferase involved in cell wall biosynthesis